tara:strand:- start:217 stop:573 length:357 start_codon:yes stop_codon:yes gene_type:complete
MDANPEDEPKKSLSAENIFPADFEEMESLIKETMQDMFKKERIKRKIKRGAESEMLTRTCSEFMNSFIIMGYNTQNEPIDPIFYCRSELEADALSHYLQRFFISLARDMTDPGDKFRS